MTKIFGFIGRARNGKSTAADVFEVQSKNLGLSVGLYDIGAAVLKYCIANNLIPAKKREDLLPEELSVLQQVGKAKREENPNYWINQIEAAIAADAKNIALIPNVRYTNEARMVKQRGGAIIRTTALNLDGSEYIAEDRPPNHPSETELWSYPADFHITAYRGQIQLVHMFAATIFDHVIHTSRAEVL